MPPRPLQALMPLRSVRVSPAALSSSAHFSSLAIKLDLNKDRSVYLLVKERQRSDRGMLDEAGCSPRSSHQTTWKAVNPSALNLSCQFAKDFEWWLIPQTQSTSSFHLSAEATTKETVKPLFPPKPPGPEDCCMSGCTHCVYDIYAEELEVYSKELAKQQEFLELDVNNAQIMQVEMKDVDLMSISMKEFTKFEKSRQSHQA
ncbi:hypothetical protein O181_018432 [Austropuccinia psidii MF-1]|uniref:Oxidoreductase-like domain-containing protein n=1 Tax=Austropuccinia psidii MF-1 TaxID=1389203 RepID=A0A9Q3C7V3_9BASI|nr:hypothetical protein [Austropuccinia psidii MF-1]